MAEDTEDKKPEEVKEPEKSETVRETERIRRETEELQKAIAEKENADAKAKIAGVSESPQPEEKKEETPAEYAKRISENRL